MRIITLICWEEKTMLNYIRADLKRIFTRVPRLVVLFLCYAGLAAIILVLHNEQWNSVVFTSGVEQYIKFLTAGLGLLELISVYSDDFRAKTMQVAIGIGIPRRNVVICKITEVGILVLADLLLFGAIMFTMGGILKSDINADQTMELIAYLVKTWISILSYMSLSMILLFFTQSSGPGTLLYVGLSIGLLKGLFELLAGIDAIQFLHLNTYTLSALLNTFGTRLLVGIFHVPSFFGILVYFAAGNLLTIFLFQKRELEF